MKRHVIYYDKMHVHIMQDGRVRLNHYRTQPKLWKSPYIWFKASLLYAVNLPTFYTPEMLEFVKTKAQSVNAIKTTTHSLNPITTPARTTLPNNTHEQPIYEIKCRKWFRWSVYFLAATAPLDYCYYWWSVYFNPSPELVKAGEAGTIVISLVMSSLIVIGCLVLMARFGDIAFYEQRVEIRRLLPFMKRHVIYYDSMHVHITRVYNSVNLSHYETPPKFWESPYTCFKADFSDVIGFHLIRKTGLNVYHHINANGLPIASNTDILEFLKTKAQSVNYR